MKTDQVYYGNQPIGTMAAIQAILNHASKPKPVITPFKMAQDYFVTEIERDGKTIKVQVEIEAFTPPELDAYDCGPADADGIPDGSGPFESEVREPEIELGAAYTADLEMTDVELTKDELETIEFAYLKHKLGADHPYFQN